jgi:hypothetical protein
LNAASPKAVEPDMDDDKREAIRADGPDPDDQAVLAALARVSEALAGLGTTIAVGRYAAIGVPRVPPRACRSGFRADYGYRGL